MTTDGVGLNETGDGSGGIPEGADAVDLQSTTSVDKEEQLSQGQPYDTLDDRGVEDTLDEGIVPPQKWSAGQGFGNTAAEQREGETLDQRIAQEEPDPAMEVDLVEGEPPLRAGEEGDVPDDVDLGEGEIPDDVVDYGILDDGEVGDARAGRLVDPDAGGTGDTEKDLVGYDVGVDGGAASAEEAAMHVIGETEYDRAIERDVTDVPPLGRS